jgi:single-stranded-DNA-specific exonuclease
LNHARWNLLPPAPAPYLAQTAGFPPLIAQFLYNRGLTEPSQLELFLNADERLAGDPFLLPDMHQAVARIYQALLSGESIAIYGDFDADGITATAVLVKGLEQLGARVIPYIPHRMNEGHGLRSNVLERLQQQGISLVISVDCGVTGVTETRKARKKGLDIIVTDHHTPLEEIPPAVAVVDPKLADSRYPFAELAGVGVAFKLLQAVMKSLGKDGEADKLIDLVALGTVADVMPLLAENRYLVKRGLELINAAPRLGVREMIIRSGLTMGSIDADSISWVMAPRLNTTGRLEHALPSYQLLMTDSVPEARELATWLEGKNEERQKMTARVITKAREQVIAEGINPILIAGDEDYPAGVIGLAAGRLTEEFYRPSVVIRTGKQTSHGSCRSIPDFNIIQALNQCRELFSKFGGHPQAAGFTMPTKNLPRLKQRLMELATTELAGVDLRPHLDIDAEVVLAQLTGSTYPAMQKLAPFGAGNRNPTFLSRNVEVIECRKIGSTGDHLKLRLGQNNTVWDGVAFQVGDCAREVVSPLDIVYNLEVDHWGGEARLRLNIIDFASPAQR